jgi:hypothetical protein
MEAEDMIIALCQQSRNRYFPRGSSGEGRDEFANKLTGAKPRETQKPFENQPGVLTPQNIRAKIESSPEHPESLGTFRDHDIPFKFPSKSRFVQTKPTVFPSDSLQRGEGVSTSFFPQSFQRFPHSPP